MIIASRIPNTRASASAGAVRSRSVTSCHVEEAPCGAATASRRRAALHACDHIVITPKATRPRLRGRRPPGASSGARPTREAVTPMPEGAARAERRIEVARAPSPIDSVPIANARNRRRASRSRRTALREPDQEARAGLRRSDVDPSSSSDLPARPRRSRRPGLEPARRAPQPMSTRTRHQQEHPAGPPGCEKHPASAGATRTLMLSFHPETTFVAVSSSGSSCQRRRERGERRPRDGHRRRCDGGHRDTPTRQARRQEQRCGRRPLRPLRDVAERQYSARAVAIGEHGRERSEERRRHELDQGHEPGPAWRRLARTRRRASLSRRPTPQR